MLYYLIPSRNYANDALNKEYSRLLHVTGPPHAQQTRNNLQQMTMAPSTSSASAMPTYMPQPDGTYIQIMPQPVSTLPSMASMKIPQQLQISQAAQAQEELFQQYQTDSTDYASDSSGSVPVVESSGNKPIHHYSTLEVHLAKEPETQDNAQAQPPKQKRRKVQATVAQPSLS